MAASPLPQLVRRAGRTVLGIAPRRMRLARSMSFHRTLLDRAGERHFWIVVPQHRDSAVDVKDESKGLLILARRQCVSRRRDERSAILEALEFSGMGVEIRGQTP